MMGCRMSLRRPVLISLRICHAPGSRTRRRKRSAVLQCPESAAPVWSGICSGKDRRQRMYAESSLTASARERRLRRLSRNGDVYAGYLLGCLLCGRREYARALAMFEKSGLPEGTRGSAVCLWKLGRKNEALEKLRAAVERMPDDDQVLWELFRVENRLVASTGDAEKLLMNRKRIRDDICTEYAVALCRRGEPDRAVTIIEGHEYVPCEGGEGAVADSVDSREQDAG